MADRLVLVGGGGHASDVLSAIEAENRTSRRWDVIGLVDDGPADMKRFQGRGIVQLGNVDVIGELDAMWLLAVGWPRTKAKLLDLLGDVRSAPATVVHPSVDVGANAHLGGGVVVLERAHISAGAVLDDHAHVSYLASVGHDTRVGELSSVMPGAHIAGAVTLGAEVLVGAGAIVLQGVQVGDRATVGAGAVVTSDIPAGSTAVGVPARVVGRSR